MASTTEIAPDIFRISVFVPEIDLQFNHFVVRDEEPLLYHTGTRAFWGEVRDAVTRILDPATIRWIGFSHVEADECGALGEWLKVAPHAVPVCSRLGAQVNADFVTGRARGMDDGELLVTGTHRFSFRRTPQLPHGWDAGLLFEECDRTLLCSDLLHQNGDVPAVTGDDVIERARASLLEYEAGALADYIPYTARTDAVMQALAELEPQTLAAMHGSTYVGDGRRTLLEFNEVLRDVFGEP